MAQPGNFTPILLYSSSTPTNVPLAANLTNSTNGAELAINIADKNLFFKDSGGTVNTVPIRQSSTSSNGWLSNTDWNTFNSKAPATSGTSLLYGNGSGGFSNVTIGSGISFAGGTLSATGTGGTVTSVTGTSPVVSSGGTTPAISLATAYGDTLNPYASKTANYILAAPNGSAGVPTFRALVAADLPSLSGTYIPYTGASSAVDLNAQTLTNIAHLGLNSTAVPDILLRAYGDNNSTSRIAIRGYSSNASSSSMRVAKFRGTYAAPQAPLSGDSLGKFELAGYGTTSANGYPQASYEGVATENWGATARGAKTLFYVTPNTTITQAVALTLDQDKSATFASTVTATSFSGSGSSLTGVVTSVGATSPVTSTGGQTPTIAMPAATTSVSGYLTSTDWNTFNGKQATLVSGTNIKTVNGTSLLGSGDVGTIGVAYGGTGLTTLTAGYIPYGNGTGALSTSGNLIFDGTNLYVGGNINANTSTSLSGFSVQNLGTHTVGLSSGAWAAFVGKVTGVGNSTVAFTMGYPSTTYMPAEFAYLQTSNAGETYGDFLWYLRSVTTDTAPLERMRLTAAGNLSVISAGGSITTAQYTANLTASRSLVSITTGGTYGNSIGSGQEKYLDISFKGFADQELARIRSWDYSNVVTAGTLTFWTGTSGTVAEAMRIAPSGGVSIGNTTDAGAGNLRFNTRNTNGILFGTASTSVLGDYEEGTWTPNKGAGLTVVGTFSSAGTYTKIGRVVTITFFVNGSTSISLAGGSALVCSNMPYAAAITSGSAFFGTGANGYNTAAANVQFYQNAIYSVQSLTGTGGIYVSGTFNT